MVAHRFEERSVKVNVTTLSRADLAEHLQKLGVQTVTAEYDGSCDSGQIDHVDFGGARVPATVRSAVETIFYDVLERLYGGWELDDGSFGEFRWDLSADKIYLVHNARIEETFTEEREL